MSDKEILFKVIDDVFSCYYKNVGYKYDEYKKRILEIITEKYEINNSEIDEKINFNEFKQSIIGVRRISGLFLNIQDNTLFNNFLDSIELKLSEKNIECCEKILEVVSDNLSHSLWEHNKETVDKMRLGIISILELYINNN